MIADDGDDDGNTKQYQTGDDTTDNGDEDEARNRDHGHAKRYCNQSGENTEDDREREGE